MLGEVKQTFNFASHQCQKGVGIYPDPDPDWNEGEGDKWRGRRAVGLRRLIVSRTSLSCKVLLHVLPQILCSDFAIAVDKSFCRLIRLWVYENPQSYSFPKLIGAGHRTLTYSEVNGKPTTSVYRGLGMWIFF